jgi:mono/diheme cytochrome c family protein
VTVRQCGTRASRAVCTDGVKIEKMQLRLRLFLAGATVVALAGSMVPLLAARPDPITITRTAAAPADLPGHSTYEETCGRCHGPEGQGGKAPWLVPFRWNYAQATDIIRRGGACGMPAFSESELSDDQVKEIVDYLKTFN